MKTTKYIATVGLIIVALVMGGNGASAQRQGFRTPEEAVKKAQSDLMEVLRSGKGFNLGVTAEQLANAAPASNIEHHELDFNKLLRAENVKSLRELTAGRQSFTTPLVSRGRVVTVVEIAQVAEGWNVVGIAGAGETEELNMLPEDLRKEGFKNVRIFEVPNLQAVVYTAENADGEMSFTNYGDKFSVKEGVRTEELVRVLNEDARRFQEEFGDQLKEGKLVK